MLESTLIHMIGRAQHTSVNEVEVHIVVNLMQRKDNIWRPTAMIWRGFFQKVEYLLCINFLFVDEHFCCKMLANFHRLPIGIDVWRVLAFSWNRY